MDIDLCLIHIRSSPIFKTFALKKMTVRLNLMIHERDPENGQIEGPGAPSVDPQCPGEPILNNRWCSCLNLDQWPKEGDT
jgi:hypothetical protein